MFDGIQSVEIPAESARAPAVVKTNHSVTERALLLAMAATMGLSTVAILGVLAASA